MANLFGEWRANIVLPGADATEVIPREQDRHLFDAGNPETDQITHHMRSDLIHSPVNPVIGGGSDLSVVGMSARKTSVKAGEVAFAAIPAVYSSSSSKSSSSSESSSSSFSSSDTGGDGKNNWLYGVCPAVSSSSSSSPIDNHLYSNGTEIFVLPANYGPAVKVRDVGCLLYVGPTNQSGTVDPSDILSGFETLEDCEFEQIVIVPPSGGGFTSSGETFFGDPHLVIFGQASADASWATFLSLENSALFAPFNVDDNSSDNLIHYYVAKNENDGTWVNVMYACKEFSFTLTESGSVGRALSTVVVETESFRHIYMVEGCDNRSVLWKRCSDGVPVATSTPGRISTGAALLCLDGVYTPCFSDGHVINAPTDPVFIEAPDCPAAVAHPMAGQACPNSTSSITEEEIVLCIASTVVTLSADGGEPVPTTGDTYDLGGAEITVSTRSVSGLDCEAIGDFTFLELDIVVRQGGVAGTPIGLFDNTHMGGVYWWALKKLVETGPVNNTSAPGQDGILEYIGMPRSFFESGTWQDQLEPIPIFDIDSPQPVSTKTIGDVFTQLRVIDGTTGEWNWEWDPLALQEPPCNIRYINCDDPLSSVVLRDSEPASIIRIGGACYYLESGYLVSDELTSPAPTIIGNEYLDCEECSTSYTVLEEGCSGKNEIWYRCSDDVGVAVVTSGTITTAAALLGLDGVWVACYRNGFATVDPVTDPDFIEFATCEDALADSRVGQACTGIATSLSSPPTASERIIVDNDLSAYSNGQILRVPAAAAGTDYDVCYEMIATTHTGPATTLSSFEAVDFCNLCERNAVYVNLVTSEERILCSRIGDVPYLKVDGQCEVCWAFDRYTYEPWEICSNSEEWYGPSGFRFATLAECSNYKYVHCTDPVTYGDKIFSDDQGAFVLIGDECYQFSERVNEACNETVSSGTYTSCADCAIKYRYVTCPKEGPSSYIVLTSDPSSTYIKAGGVCYEYDSESRDYVPTDPQPSIDSTHTSCLNCDPNWRYTVCAGETGSDLIFEEDQGAFIKVGGVCYQYADRVETASNASTIDSTHTSCLDCNPNYEYIHCTDSGTYSNLYFTSDQGAVIKVSGECYERQLSLAAVAATDPVPTIDSTHASCEECSPSAACYLLRTCKPPLNWDSNGYCAAGGCNFLDAPVVVSATINAVTRNLVASTAYSNTYGDLGGVCAFSLGLDEWYLTWNDTGAPPDGTGYWQLVNRDAGIYLDGPADQPCDPVGLYSDGGGNTGEVAVGDPLVCEFLCENDFVTDTDLSAEFAEGKIIKDSSGNCYNIVCTVACTGPVWSAGPLSPGWTSWGSCNMCLDNCASCDPELPSTISVQINDPYGRTGCTAGSTSGTFSFEYLGSNQWDECFWAAATPCVPSTGPEAGRRIYYVMKNGGFSPNYIISDYSLTDGDTLTVDKIEDGTAWYGADYFHGYSDDETTCAGGPCGFAVPLAGHAEGMWAWPQDRSSCTTPTTCNAAAPNNCTIPKWLRADIQNIPTVDWGLGAYPGRIHLYAYTSCAWFSSGSGFNCNEVEVIWNSGLARWDVFFFSAYGSTCCAFRFSKAGVQDPCDPYGTYTNPVTEADRGCTGPGSFPFCDTGAPGCPQIVAAQASGMQIVISAP